MKKKKKTVNIFEPKILLSENFKISELCNLSEILPQKLYLTNLITSRNFSLLQKHNVTHILTLSNQRRNIYGYLSSNNSVKGKRKSRSSYVEKIQYKNVVVNDLSTVRISKFFPECYEFIFKAIVEQNGAVVVNCNAGISRSSSVVIMFIMKYKRLTLRESFLFVQKQRLFIQPNVGFLKQLIEYEMKNRKEKSIRILEYRNWRKKNPSLNRKLLRVLKKNRDALEKIFDRKGGNNEEINEKLVSMEKRKKARARNVKTKKSQKGGSRSVKGKINPRTKSKKAPEKKGENNT